MIFRVILLPFAGLYQMVTWFRNRLYDLGIRPSASFDLPVICVGNLSVGGTGKTPMVEYLLRLTLNQYRVATLSRGYKRTTKGFRIASSVDTADTIGDEPLQFYKKFGDQAIISVGEERAMAIPALLQQHDLDMVVLDDAFQHRRVKPSFAILLTDFNHPFYDDFLLPAGRLREYRTGAERADVIVVTKCPGSASDEDLLEIEKSIREYVMKPVFFSAIEYGNPLAYRPNNVPLSDQVVLITGIANPKPLLEYVRANYTLVDHFEFPDHHQYQESDITRILQRINKASVSILTTEKDMVKLSASQMEPLLRDFSCFYLPITMRFLKNGRDFDEMVLTHIQDIVEKKTGA